MSERERERERGEYGCLYLYVCVPASVFVICVSPHLSIYLSCAFVLMSVCLKHLQD